MYLLFSHKKLSTIVLFITFLIVSVKGPLIAETVVEEKIEKGNYTLEIINKLQQVKEPISGSKVVCGGHDKEIVGKISHGFGMDISDTVLEGLLTTFGLGLGLDTPKARIGAEMELRKQILRESKRFTEKRLLLEVTLPVTVKALSCYNQRAFIVYQKENYTVKTTRRGFWPWGEDKSEFHWEENADFQILIEAEYDEIHCKGCEIQGKKEPVTGRDDRQLWACIPYDQKETYLIPLYWDEDGKIIDLIPLLPKEKQNEIRGR